MVDSSTQTCGLNWTNSQQQRTTAYHPAANGMVEHLHHQLLWSVTPILAYGSMACLSFCFKRGFTLPKWSMELPSDYLDNFLFHSTPQQNCRTQLLISSIYYEHYWLQATSLLLMHISHFLYIQICIATCTHASIRHDAMKPPLQLTYNGPYNVLEHKE